MSLSRDEAAKQGFAFSIEGEKRPSNPSVEIWEGNLTIDNHTERIQGSSEEAVLAEVEKRLIRSRREL